MDARIGGEATVSDEGAQLVSKKKTCDGDGSLRSNTQAERRLSIVLFGMVGHDKGIPFPGHW